MKFVFLTSVYELTSQGENATPAKIAKTYNMTYRHILRIANDLAYDKYIIRNIEDWRVRYELTQKGMGIVFPKNQ